MQGIYAERYGAHITEFAPVLLALRDAQGALVAAVGYRCAALEPLFLERYLDGPVEQALLGADAPSSARRDMVEVAHLVALKPGEGRRMMAELFGRAGEAVTDDLRGGVGFDRLSVVGGSYQPDAASRDRRRGPAL